MAKRKLEKGWSGIWLDQTRSALQKSIRRGDLDGAAHWAVELYLSAETWWLWHCLLTVVSEDVGPAWPEGPAVIRALYENWRWCGQDLAWMHAVVLLVRAPKSRLVDHMMAGHLMSHHREFARRVPDYALDIHTVAGRVYRDRREDNELGQRHWWEEAGKLNGELPDPDAERYQELVKRWWAEGRQYVEPWKPGEDHKPKEALRKPYNLPLGVVDEGDTVTIPATDPNSGPWVVNRKTWECTCPAFARYAGDCKHVKVLKAMTKNGTGPR